MRTNANLWAVHPESLSAYLQQRRTIARVQADSQEGQEKRKAREHPLRGKVLMASAKEAERLWYPINVIGRTALVHVSGVMVKGGDPYWGETCTLELRRSVEAATADPEIDAIVLRLDTPGGSVDGLAELGDAVFAARGTKTLIAQVDGMCCSAGYYVASQADEIRSGRMDTVGSIGTRMMMYDWHALFEKEGIKAIPIDTGPYKSTGALGTELTEEQQAFLQEYVDSFFADFLAMISRGRPALSGEKLAAVSDGRWWDAPKAEALGLVDRLCTLDDTMAELSASAASAAGRTAMARARLELARRDSA